MKKNYLAHIDLLKFTITVLIQTTVVQNSTKTIKLFLNNELKKRQI